MALGRCLINFSTWTYGCPTHAYRNSTYRFPANVSSTGLHGIRPVLPVLVSCSYPKLPRSSILKRSGQARVGAETFRPFWDVAPAQKLLG